jgi:hypothetical protein
MPSVLISVPLYPNVPALPGVPQLLRSALGVPANNVTLGPQVQSALFGAVAAGPTWAILDANLNPVIVPDSFLNFDIRKEWKLSDYPVQQGSFASYNKVIQPFETSVRFSKGGNLSARTQFLNQIEAIEGDTNLYTVVTPEKAYPSVNVTRSEITRRGAEGAFFLCEVDVYFRQIIEVTATYSSTAADTSNAVNPTAQPDLNNGLQQASPNVPPQAAAAAANAIINTPN